MPNTFFRFRQFTVHQERAAMKVCTDACLFGAWMAETTRQQKIEHILDIGAGTGLLSLMVAQATNAAVDAVEIDTEAYGQAGENFEASPWKERLHIYNTPVQQFDRGYCYDLIVTNPPFYENDLKSPDKKRNAALHASELSFEELINSIKRLLKPNGRAGVLIPFEKSERFESLLSKYGLVINRKLLVKQSEKHRFFRVMYLLSKNTFKNAGGGAVPLEISIRNNSGQYTDEFNRLLRDYYL